MLNLQGLWTRYDDLSPLLHEIVSLGKQAATARLQEIYSAPIKPELISQRVQEIRDSGVTVAGALSPQRTKQFAKHGGRRRGPVRDPVRRSRPSMCPARPSRST